MDKHSILKSDLFAGDVLCTKGSYLISKLVCFMCNSTYSHAALWNGDDFDLIESSDGGIRSTSLDSFKKCELIHVYRHRDLGNDEDRRSVVDAAKKYLGNRYAGEQLFLMGLCLLLMKPKLHAGFEQLLRSEPLRLRGTTIDSIKELRRVIKEAIGSEERARKPMICSQLVATAFYDANQPLTLEIVASSISKSMKSKEQLNFEQACYSFFELPPIIADEEVSKALRSPSIDSVIGDQTSLRRVSPEDISTSKSLRYIGSLETESSFSFT